MMNFLSPVPPLFSAACFLKRVPTFLSEKIFLIDELNALFFGKTLRTFAGHQNVRRLFHYQTGEADRVLNVSDNGNGAGFERLTVHDRGIHFMYAGDRKNGTFAGIEKRIVFERADSRFSRVQTRTAMLQNFPT